MYTFTEVVYMRFHVGRNEIFSFRCLVNFLITAYMIQTEMKLIAGVISLKFLQKWNFISGDKISCKHYPKWNRMKGNICKCVNKNVWLLLNGPFILDHPRNEIHFISLAMKSNVNRISFMMGWNFVSGLT